MLLNHATEMCYIGQAKDLNARLKEHRRQAKNGSTTRIHEAIRDFGWDCFEVIVLEQNLTTFKELNDYETLWIEKLDVTNPNVGYNVRAGGQNEKAMNQRTAADMSDDERAKFAEYGRRAQNKLTVVK